MRAIMILCIGCAVWPLARAADESPATLADAVTLASRVAELEARVQALEATMTPKAATAKPVLEVHSESWCGPCQIFERELQARGEIQANTYNPNAVAPPEMELLETSIWEDGYTQPVVTYYFAMSE